MEKSTDVQAQQKLLDSIHRRLAFFRDRLKAGRRARP